MIIVFGDWIGILPEVCDWFNNLLNTIYLWQVIFWSELRNLHFSNGSWAAKDKNCIMRGHHCNHKSAREDLLCTCTTECCRTEWRRKWLNISSGWTVFLQMSKWAHQTCWQGTSFGIFRNNHNWGVRSVQIYQPD